MPRTMLAAWSVCLLVLPAGARSPDESQPVRSRQEAEKVAPVRNVLTAYLDRANIHPPAKMGRLTIFPISLAGTRRLESVLNMDEALRKGVLIVEELDPPTVQRARFTNKSAGEYIFLMSGEVVIGGYQNRTFCSDALLGPNSTAILPLYCVQKGRWRGRKRFAGTTVAPQAVRARAAQNAGQGKVHAEVDRANRRLGASPVDKDLAAAMTRPENLRRLARLRKGIVPRLPPNCAGVVVAWDGTIIAADLFNSAELFAKMRQKVLDSYLSQYRPGELQDPGGQVLRRPGRPTQNQVRFYLRACYRARFASGPKRGVGRIYHVRGARYGQTLAYRPGRVYPLAGPRHRPPPVREYMVHTALMQEIVPVGPIPRPRPRRPRIPRPMPQPRRLVPGRNGR